MFLDRKIFYFIMFFVYLQQGTKFDRALLGKNGMKMRHIYDDHETISYLCRK